MVVGVAEAAATIATVTAPPAGRAGRYSIGRSHKNTWNFFNKIIRNNDSHASVANSSTWPYRLALKLKNATSFFVSHINNNANYIIN